MNQLTTFERALLQQFERLARDLETSLSGFRHVDDVLQALSQTTGKRLERIEADQRTLAAALSKQSEQTKHLITQVNKLLNTPDR